jgi:hypothetical protein
LKTINDPVARLDPDDKDIGYQGYLGPGDKAKDSQNCTALYIVQCTVQYSEVQYSEVQCS